MSRAIEERGLPADVHTERFILGAVLLDGARFDELAMTLEPDDFSLDAHRRIWAAMSAVSLRGVGIDHATVADELRTTGNLEAVGGFSGVAGLDDGIPQLANLGSWCGILREKKILRDVIRMARSIEESAILGTETGPELIGRADAMVRALGTKSEPSSAFQNPGQVITSHKGLTAYLDRGKVAGVPTGFRRLDEMTGGIRPGHLWVIAADTAGGKSTFASHVAHNAALALYPGAFVSLEMTAQEVTDGLICRAGQVNTQSIRRGMYQAQTRPAANAIADLPIYISDRPGITIPKLHAELRRLKAEKGITFAVVDYIQLMQPVGRFGTRAEAVGHLTRGLKLIAMDLGIGVVALSQFSRPADKTVKRRPVLADLKESSSIEQDANLVLALYGEYQVSPMTEYPTEAHVLKQRGGPVGMIPFLWRKATGTFIECEQEAA